MNLSQFMMIPTQDQTFAECMGLLRQYSYAQHTIKYLISDYIFCELQAACTTQCKLEGIL